MCRTQKYDHDGEDEGVTPVMRMMIRVGAKRLLLTGFTPFPMICCIGMVMMLVMAVMIMVNGKESHLLTLSL